MYWLSLLIANGVIGALCVLCFSRADCRQMALINALISLAIFYKLTLLMNFSSGDLQQIEQFSWINILNIQYFLAIDGLSWALIALTLVINIVVILSSFIIQYDRMRMYLALFLFMQSMVIGVFTAFDAILFYFFWEGMLLPMYLCIGIWGAENRSFASMKFFLYTFLGSILMLLGFIYLGLQAESFSFASMQSLQLSMTEQLILFFALMGAFAVKVPMFPFHTWLPDAHTEAPAAGSVVLAALMLKVGAYGFIRLSMPILPDASKVLAPMMIGLSLISVVYIGIIAYSQTDIKRLIAYSSVAHMGFVTLGLFLIYSTSDAGIAQLGYVGAVIQMISHAFGSGSLFFAFGLLYLRIHERSMLKLQGIGEQLPLFSGFFMLFVFSTIGVPFTAGFVGEWMVIVSAIQNTVWIGLLCVLTIVLSAIYLLSMYRKVFFGQPIAEVALLEDVSWQEIGVLGILTIVILGIGLYPSMLVDVLAPPVEKLVSASLVSKIGIVS